MATADPAALPVDPDDRARLPALLMVVAAAVLWSTSGIVFRLIEDADQWQVVFWRSGTLVPFLILLIVLRSGFRPMAMVRAAGWHAPLAGVYLGIAFTCWILALAETTVANAVFILCCSPIASVLLARIFLGERLGRSTVFAIACVIVGVGIITAGAVEGGRLLGNLFALGAALGFASYTVTVRVRRDVDMLPAVFFAGLFSALVGLAAAGGDIAIGGYDIWLCTVLGVGQIGLGLVIYTAGARHLPAVELTLLSLIEVVLAPIWVWALLAERPSPETLIGGTIMLAGVAGQAVVMMRRRRPG